MINENQTKNYSEYLTFRSFYTGFENENTKRKRVFFKSDIKKYIAKRLSGLTNPAILLSGGMDSAVLAAFMPAGSTAYTICHEGIEENEIATAREYCEKFNLRHIVLTIKQNEYLECIDRLMINKKMPLSPAEPVIYLAAFAAKKHGHDQVVTGGGADTKFGGFPNKRKNVSPKKYLKIFMKSYLNPKKILKDSVSAKYVFLRYSKINLIPFERRVDSRKFLDEIGVERFAFSNAVNSAGCEHISPFSEIVYHYSYKKNAERPKYIIADLFKEIYGKGAPKKFGLQKPIHSLENYRPSSDLFMDFDYLRLDMPRKFLIYSLERFDELRKQGLV